MNKPKIPIFRSHFDLGELKITDKKNFNESTINAEILKTGTTTVGLVCKDGVCLATDKRATGGLFVASKTAEKLNQIQPNLFMTIAGSVADAQYLIEMLKAETNLYNLRRDHPIGVKTAANLLSGILFNNRGLFQVGLILGGYTEDVGPELFDIGGLGSLLPDKFCAVGSGSPYAIGVLESKYNPELTVEPGMKICAGAVRSAIIRDIASGNGIDVVGITKDGFTRKFYPIDNDPIAELKE